MVTPTKKSPAKAAAKKPATPKTPTPKTPAPAPVPTSPDDPSLYILSELVLSHGPATPDEVFALVVRDRAALIAEGALVATPRISTDSARLYGRAGDFWKSANPTQKQALRGLSADMLRVAVWAAQHGQELHETRRLADSAGSARKDQRQGKAQALRQKAVVVREQLTTLLRLAAGGDEQLGAAIDRAYGRISKPEELAQALTELVKLGHQYLGSPDPALARRAVGAGLDAAYLDAATALAAQAGAELKTATATREAPAVSQADVDLWDGVNLYFLECIIDLFEVGNQLEPTVPRLVPMSLRAWFGAAAKKSKPPAPAPTQPST